MIRLIIVDDEVLSRIGIKSFLEEKEDIIVAGVFSQASDALDFLSKNQIDIVITDIEMSDMNGLEFIKNIRKDNLAEGIIILSCHDNFEYAREAISLGTDSYLLKHSVDEKILIDEINKVFTKISTTSTRKNMKKDNNPVTLIDQSGVYMVGILKFPKYYQGEEIPMSGQIEENMLVHLLEEIVVQYHMGTLFAPYKKDMFIIFRFDANTKTSEREAMITEYAFELKKNVEQYVNKSLIIGLSQELTDSRDIPICYTNAVEAAELYFYDEQSFLFKYSNVNSAEVPGLHFTPENFLDDEGIKDFMEELKIFLNRCRRNNIRVKTLNDILIHEVNALVYKVLNQYRFNDEVMIKWNSVYQFIPAVMYAENVEVLKSNLKKVMRQFQEELLYQLRKDEFSEIFHFIDSNLSEKLSLGEMANMNCMSIPSFCKKFKERTGMTLVQYINQQKIEKVKVYLSDRRYSLGQIAEITGFTNENYMIRVFKKVTGQTVKDYRSDLEDI